MPPSEEGEWEEQRTQLLQTNEKWIILLLTENKIWLHIAIVFGDTGTEEILLSV